MTAPVIVQENHSTVTIPAFVGPNSTVGKLRELLETQYKCCGLKRDATSYFVAFLGDLYVNGYISFNMIIGDDIVPIDKVCAQLYLLRCHLTHYIGDKVYVDFLKPIPIPELQEVFEYLQTHSIYAAFGRDPTCSMCSHYRKIIMKYAAELKNKLQAGDPNFQSPLASNQLEVCQFLAKRIFEERKIRCIYLYECVKARLPGESMNMHALVAFLLGRIACFYTPLCCY